MAVPSLAGLLNIGLSGLGAARAGIATHGRNAANANTPGYVREQVNLQSGRGAPLDGGVMVRDISRAADPFLSSQERTSDGVLGRSDTMKATFEALEARIAAQGHNLVEAIAALFGGISELESAPADPVLRQDVIGKAQGVASTFQSAAGAVTEAQGLTDAQLSALASEATRIAGALAGTNAAAASPSPDPAVLDQRELLARQLAAITGGQARVDSDGHMRFVLDNGAVLVDGNKAAEIRATADNTLGGHVRIDLVDGPHVTDVTGQMVSGKMGGLLAVRDGALESARTAIDQLAYDFSTAMNTAHRQGQGLDGQTGIALFNDPLLVDGAAAAMQVDANVAADHRNLATGTVGAGPADNGGARALSALASQRLAGGGTRSFTDHAIDILSSVGHAAALAGSEHDVALSRSTALQAIRDDRSGVSMEDELAGLAQFQHAHEAAVRFLAAVDETFSDLLQRL